MKGQDKRIGGVRRMPVEEQQNQVQGQPPERRKRVRLWTPGLVLLTLINLAASLALYLLMVVMTDFAMEAYDVPPALGGAAITAFVGTSLLSRVLLGAQIDRWGARKAIYIGLTINFIASALYIVPMPYIPFILVRCFHGIGFALVSGSTASAAAMVIPAERKAEGVGYFAMMQALGTGVGPFVAIVLTEATAGYTALFVFTAVVAGLAVALSIPLRNMEQLAHRADAPGRSRTVAGATGIGRFIQISVLPLTAVLFLIYLGYSGLVSFVVPYTDALGLTRAASFFFVVYAVAIVISRLFTGRIVDRYGENSVMYLSLVIAAVGLVLLSIVHSGAVLLTAAAFMGFGIGTTQSVEQAVIARDVSPNEYGRANSTFLMSMDLGSGVGPVVIGAFIPVLGYPPCYLGLAGAAVVALLLYHFAHGRTHRRSRTTIDG